MSFMVPQVQSCGLEGLLLCIFVVAVSFVTMCVVAEVNCAYTQSIKSDCRVPLEFLNELIVRIEQSAATCSPVGQLMDDMRGLRNVQVVGMLSI